MNEGYTKVFVSLDGTEQQDFVLARAIKVAANNGAKLIIGHVVDSTAPRERRFHPSIPGQRPCRRYKNSIAKQLEEAKANPDIPEVEVMIRVGRIRDTQGRGCRRGQARPGRARGLSSIKYALLGSDRRSGTQHRLRHLGREIGSFSPAQACGLSRRRPRRSRPRVGFDNPSRPCAFVTVLQQVT